MKRNGLLVKSIILSIVLMLGMTAQASASVVNSDIAVLSVESSGLPMMGNFKILYIDGQRLQSEISDSKSYFVPWIRNVLLSGVPTVVFGGNTILQDIFGELLIKEEIEQPIFAHGLKVYPDKTVKNRLVSDQLYITGFNITNEEVEAKASEWARDKISNNQDASVKDFSALASSSDLYSVSFGTSGTPYWLLIGVDTLLVYMNPVGNLNITRSWYQLIYDGSNTYDWLTVINEVTSTPGRIAYGSDWSTADIWNYDHFDYYFDPLRLVDHGPPTTSGVSTVTYQTGVTNGVEGGRVTSEMSVSYSTQDVSIHDDSVTNDHLAKWWHDVPEDKTTGQNTYKIKPGATMRFLPLLTSAQTYSGFQVQYGHWVWIIYPIWGYWEYWKSPEFNLVTTISQPRTVDVFVVKASDSPSWWVGNVNNVESGVLEAVNDAYARTWVKLANEQINVYEVTSTQDLLGLAQNPPWRAVFVDTHGEVIPTPNQYFGPSVNIWSPSDGGTIYYSPTVYADVYPPPPSKLQLSVNLNTGQTSYVWYRWDRPSTGASSDWRPMSPQSDAGGTYYAGISLPAYDTYVIYVGAFSNNIWTNAYITVYYKVPPPPSGGGGCPYVSTWDGSKFVLDNNLLSKSKCSNGSDVVDYYKLQQALIPNSDGTYSVSISEFQQEHSFLDNVELLAVDHSSGVNLAVSPKGEILTYTVPSPPASAIDNNKKSVKDLIDSTDRAYYEGYNGSYITLNFGEDIDISQGAKLVLRADMIVKVSIYVQVQDARGNWNNVATVIPRANWATEIIDMSEHLPDGKGNLKVRLYFTANHKIDFVGLDTSPPATTKVKTSRLVSARHGPDGIETLGAESNKDTTFQNLLSSDDFFAELTPGYRIKMDFMTEEKETPSDVRDFILVTEGHYKKAGDPPRAVAVNWQPWFDLLEDRTRNYGWVWTNVAGYSAYYFGNTWYTSKFPGYSLVNDPQHPRENGLKTFLSQDLTAYYYDGHKARRDADFIEKSGFDPSFYNDLPTWEVGASRPLASRNPIWNTVGMVDTSTSDYVVASVTMNKSMPGSYIHCGLASDVNSNGVANEYYDDFLKGYIATMLAVEEARAYLMYPKTLTQTFGNQHAATFSVTMLPGGWGTGEGTFDGVSRIYRYVDLVLTMPAHYKDYIYTVTYPRPPYPPITYTYIHELSVADFKLSSSDTEIWGRIDLTESGWETGDRTRELMDDLGWWQIGLGADILGGIIGIPYLGSAIGLIPILIRGPSPPEKHPFDRADRGVWANGTSTDSNDDEWGTVSIYVRVIFLRSAVPRNYTFTLGMVSWIGVSIPEAWFYDPRFKGLTANIEMQFAVTG